MASTFTLATLGLELENNTLSAFINAISNFPKDKMSLSFIQLTRLQEIRIRWRILFSLMGTFVYCAEWQFVLVVSLELNPAPQVCMEGQPFFGPRLFKAYTN